MSGSDTPITDAEARSKADERPIVRLYGMAKLARQLERRMRHAERLLEESLMYIQFGTFKEFDAKIRRHLTAAAKEETK